MGLKYQFPQSVDTVFNLLCDPDFLVERCMAVGELSADCEVEEDGDETIIKMTREVERELPKFLAKLFNPVQTLEFTEKWQNKGDIKEGTYTVVVVGQPVTVSAKFKLKPTSNGGCEYTIEHSAKANIPLVGGKVEKFIVNQTGEGVDKEIAYLKEQLK
jgi:hypothetical protein